MVPPYSSDPASSGTPDLFKATRNSSCPTKISTRVVEVGKGMMFDIVVVSFVGS
jgi:hypothetical protein